MTGMTPALMARFSNVSAGEAAPGRAHAFDRRGAEFMRAAHEGRSTAFSIGLLRSNDSETGAPKSCSERYALI